MVKLVNTADLKSADRKVLPVRFRLGAPLMRFQTFFVWAAVHKKTGINSRFFCALTSPSLRKVAIGGTSKVPWYDETFAAIGFDIDAKGSGRVNFAHTVRQTVLVGRVPNQVNDLGLAGLLVTAEHQQ
jgi:hypothetical protein